VNIVHLTRRFDPSLGGVETHVRALSHCLVKDGHLVTVLTQATKAHQPLYEVKNGITIIRIPITTGEHKLRVWSAVAQHRKLFDQADIIQVHDVFWWIMPFYFRVRKKVCTTFHGWETHYPIRFTAKAQRLLFSALSQKTIHIGSWIQQFYWDTPSHILIGGVATKKRALSTSRSINQIVFVGRLEADTEIVQYLSLCRLLQNTFPHCRITWVGDGRFSSACRKVGSVTGMVQNPADYMIKADIVFASSYLAMLEAQSLGKIVVALYSHPLKEAYLKSFNGKKYMIMAHSPKEAFRQIVSLFANKQKLLHLQRQSARWAHLQTWEKVTKQYISLWHSVIQ
jgi:glycosyltransferase involved in cell wall biosynthesis